MSTFMPKLNQAGTAWESRPWDLESAVDAPAAYTTAGDVPITAAALGNASMVRVYNAGSTVLPVTIDASLLSSGRAIAFAPAIPGQTGFYLGPHTNITAPNWVVEGGATVSSNEAVSNTVYIGFFEDGKARVLSGTTRAYSAGFVESLPAATAWAATVTPTSFVGKAGYTTAVVTVTVAGVTVPMGTVSVDYTNDFNNAASSGTLGSIIANGVTTYSIPLASAPGLGFKPKITGATGTGGTVGIAVVLS